MMTYLQTKFKYLLFLGIFILPLTSYASINVTFPTNTTSSISHTNNVICIYASWNISDTSPQGQLGAYATNPYTGLTFGSVGEGVKLWVYEVSTFSACDTFNSNATFTYIYATGGVLTLTDPNAPITPPYNPSLFGTVMSNPTSLLNDLDEITRQNMWGSVIGWIIVSTGIYTAMWLAMALIGMLFTSFRNDKEKTDRINRLADSAIAEAEAFDKKHHKS